MVKTRKGVCMVFSAFVILLVLIAISEIQLNKMMITMHVYQHKNIAFHMIIGIMLMGWVAFAGWYYISLPIYLTGLLILFFANTIPYRSRSLLMNNFTLINFLIFSALFIIVIGIMGWAKTPFLELIDDRLLRLATLDFTLLLFNLVCSVLLKYKPDFLWEEGYDRRKALLYTWFLVICIVYHMMDAVLLVLYQTNSTSYVLLIGGELLVLILMFMFLRYNYVFERSEMLNKEYEASAVLMAQNHFAKEELRHLSGYDSLTSAYNRREICSLIHKSIEQNKPFICVFVDLDGLKYINDTYGHSYGDLMLKHFAGESLKVLNDQGKLARIGGDEFLLMFENMTVDEVELKMKELQLILLEPVSAREKVTFSYGISFSHKTVDDYIVFADKAMYRQKKLKRGGIE